MRKKELRRHVLWQQKRIIELERDLRVLHQLLIDAQIQLGQTRQYKGVTFAQPRQLRP